MRDVRNYHLLVHIYTIRHPFHRMGGLGVCNCCKEEELLTEHHDKQINQNLMVCRDCNSFLEHYQKLIEKYKDLLSSKKN